jgi:hypothetical protein
MCRTVLSIAAVTALAGTAACSSSDSGGGDEGIRSGGDLLAALRLADKSTSDADSAKIESTATMGELMSMRSDGALDWADGLQGTMTITYTGGQAAEQMSQLGITSTEARYLPDAYYANMGDTFAEQYEGKHWIRYAYDDLENSAGASGAYIKDIFKNVTPNQSVKLLLASGDVEKVGESKVRGENTTHYSGTVDVADLAEQNSNLGEEKRAELQKQLEQAGITTETIDLWINEDDLLVKKVEKGETANGTLSSTVYYSDYGVEVSPKEPPAADTVDFAELMKDLPAG